MFPLFLDNELHVVNDGEVHGPWGSKANSWSVGACLYCRDLNLPINKLFSSKAHINIVLIACQLLDPKLDSSGPSLPRGGGVLEYLS